MGRCSRGQNIRDEEQEQRMINVQAVAGWDGVLQILHGSDEQAANIRQYNSCPLVKSLQTTLNMGSKVVVVLIETTASKGR